MATLQLKHFVLGPLYTNSYLIFDPATRKGCIIDIPHPFLELEAFIKQERIDVLCIILTHGHFDHIGGVDSCVKPFYIHKHDLAFLREADLNGSSFFASPFTVEREPLLYPGSELESGVGTFHIIHTPGHTPGSVSLRINNWLFSGDTLFFGSIGRTDMPYASGELLQDAIQKKILSLPDETIVYPGHGPRTTVGREKRSNLFLWG